MEFDKEPNQSKNLLEKMNKKFYRVNTIKASQKKKQKSRKSSVSSIKSNQTS